MFGGNFAPSGWALCNGQLLSIAQYSALFAVIGTYYGGNGTTTFALPNMQSRVPIHWGQGAGLSSYVIGQMSGTENVTLLNTQMPIHSHLVNADGNGGGKNSPAGNFPGTVAGTAAEKMYSAGPGNTTMSPTMIGNAGGNQPFPIVQPYLAVTFIIALNGIFPSRN
jgi:microcystin-dependent protein